MTTLSTSMEEALISDIIWQADNIVDMLEAYFSDIHLYIDDIVKTLKGIHELITDIFLHKACFWPKMGLYYGSFP